MGQFDLIYNPTHLWDEWVGVHLQELQITTTIGVTMFIICMCMCMSRGLIYPPHLKIK